MTRETNLIAIWQSGVNAVRGAEAVTRCLDAQNITRPTHIIAVGKAASSMAAPAAACFPDAPCLIVTKYDHSADAPEHATVMESAHPVPDSASLRAGAALCDAVDAMGADAHLLMLVSGGASSLAEALPENMQLDDLEAETKRLLASGADIHAMNARRKEISQIKGGKLLQRFSGEKITTLAISDVEGDALSVIGSGIGEAPNDPAFTFDPHIIASNALARAAVADAADLQIICNEEALYDDVTALAPRLGAALRDGPAGLYIWGGEPTVRLPDNPGKGGRNMALGLALAKEIQGFDIDILVAGTDGTDGPTDAAGAQVNGRTWQDSAADALADANAYPWLDAHGALFKSGPTGTNVMDLCLAVKHSDG